MTFLDKLLNISKKNNSLVCVGLDTDIEKIPKFLLKENDPIFSFNKTIIDAKRGDIGNTSRMYAKSIFEDLKADAVTVSPYLGGDSISPFLAYEDKCAFILCLTSNKGAEDFQLQEIDNKPLYELVAEKIVQWNQKGNCGLVVGATYPDQLKRIREIVGKLPILIPGVGAQKGDVEKTVRFGTDNQGNLAIINSARGIIYASTGEDFADAAREKAESLRDSINLFRKK